MVVLLLCQELVAIHRLGAEKVVAKLYENTYDEFRQRYDVETSKVFVTNLFYKADEKHRLFEARRL